MAKVEFIDVEKKFDKFVAIENLNLTIEDGEFVVLVGPSGCGKTTTLRMLAGLEDVTKGEILIDGKRVNDVSPRDRDIAMVFQSYALYPHMNVFDNMAFGLKLRKIPKQEIVERVNYAAEILQLTTLLKRKPRQLSGGQRQRVALGRAIVRNPVAFLMDEPLSNLDAKLRVQARTEIAGLQKRLGATFVYVTHDQVEAMTMGHRVAVFDHGVLRQVDKPTTVYEKPADTFVAQFIGNPGMNMYEVDIKNMGQDFYVDIAKNWMKLPSRYNKALEAKKSNKVVVGIRPEHIYVKGFAPDTVLETAQAKFKLSLVELLGKESYLFLDTGLSATKSKLLTLSVEGIFTGKIGDTIETVFDMSKVHLFDIDTKLAIEV